MIRLKDDSVEISNLSAGLLFALTVADQVFAEYGYETVVTSANDADHAQTSLHYANNAFDLRTRHIPEAVKLPIRDEIKRRLGIDYDVLLESDHLHLELQPRRR